MRDIHGSEQNVEGGRCDAGGAEEGDGVHAGFVCCVADGGNGCSRDGGGQGGPANPAPAHHASPDPAPRPQVTADKLYASASAIRAGFVGRGSFLAAMNFSRPIRIRELVRFSSPMVETARWL